MDLGNGHLIKVGYLACLISLFLDSKILHNNLGVQTYWSKLITGKVNLHGWKTQQKRLATFDNLLKRGILPDPKPCPFCATSIENEDHIFADCFFAKILLREIAIWWTIDPPQLTRWNLYSLGENLTIS